MTFGSQNRRATCLRHTPFGGYLLFSFPYSVFTSNVSTLRLLCFSLLPHSWPLVPILECEQNQECHHQCEQRNRFCQSESHNCVSESFRFQ